MRNRILAGLCLTFILLAAGCASWEHEHMQPPLSGILDGKTFAGEVGRENNPTMADTLAFKDGYFHSSACDPYHFNSGAYLAIANGDTTTFQVITRNRHGAQIVWNGTVKGDKLEGKMVLYEKGKEPVKQWVRGTLQQ